MSRVHIM